MFLLIPLIFIFLLLAYNYLYVTTLFIEIVIYTLISAIVVLSIILYKKIKDDIKQQEINVLEAELIALKKRFSTIEDGKQKDAIQRKIDTLTDEINSKL